MSEPGIRNEKGGEAEKILGVFRDLAKDPHGWLKDWKALHKRKIIACMPMQIPEEIIHAAGALPVVVPEKSGPIKVASKHLQNFFCGYARGVIEAVLQGELDLLDGLVFQDTCHTMRPVFDIIHANHPFPYMQRIFLPLALQKPQAKPFLLGELRRFRASIEKCTGSEVSEGALRQSIDIYNENRELMANLYDLRRGRPELVTAREMVTVNRAGMIMPKEEHSALLRALIPALREGKPPLDNKEDRTRLVLTGSLCEAPPDVLLDLAEEMGGLVVDDDLYTGSRYFLTKVPAGGDPLEGLADAYLHGVSPCPTRIYRKLELGPYLVEMVKEAGAKGLIIIMVKFCEAHDYTYPHMRRHLDAAGISYLMIKTEHGAATVEQTKTRLQAFMEILGEK